MKIILINDEGQSIASFEHPVQSDDRGPAQVFALLDLLEKLLETGQRGGCEVASAALSEAETVVS